MEFLACYASSLSVDAARFDKLVINVAFEISPPRLACKAPSRLYGLNHYKKALKVEGVRLVQSQEELLFWIHRYLDDSALDREGRRRLVQAQCWQTDGRAVERIARRILRAAGVITQAS